MPQKKEKNYSIKAQLMLVMLGHVVLIFIMVQLLLHGFLGRYYQHEKTNTLTAVYNSINHMTDTSHDFSYELMQMAEEGNIEVLITNAEFKPVNSTSADPSYLSARLFGYYTGLFNETFEITKKTADYRIQTSTEGRIGLNYLEMWGKLDNGDWFLLRTPLESITTAVSLTSNLLLLICLPVLIISLVFIVIIAECMAQPITQLTVLSKRMAKLDFSARYNGSTINEIQVLGENFNAMSEELQKAIAELKSANNELQRDNERKAEIDEMRKEFLNNVSHELKTPIALIQSYAEGLVDGIAEDEDSRNFYCDVIVDEATKMNALVKKLLTLNQLEFGQDTVQMACFDLTSLIANVIEKMKLMAADKGAEISFPHNKTIWVWGDDFKIEEVVTNFLSNAINHVDYDKKIEISLLEDNGIVKTTVFNTGNPIPTDDLGRIWEKFYKVDKAHTREYGGSGIGLSIVKVIIDGHNQTCGVRNYDNGVAFWFTLEEQKPM